MITLDVSGDMVFLRELVVEIKSSDKCSISIVLKLLKTHVIVPTIFASKILQRHVFTFSFLKM